MWMAWSLLNNRVNKMNNKQLKTDVDDFVTYGQPISDWFQYTVLISINPTNLGPLLVQRRKLQEQST